MAHEIADGLRLLDGFVVGTGAANPKKPHGLVRLWVRFDPPLDLGLCIYRGTRPNYSQGQKRVPTSLMAEVFADEPLRAQVFLEGRVSEAINRVGLIQGLVVSDMGGSVIVHRRSQQSRAEALARKLVMLARAVNAQREVTPVATPLSRHCNDWLRYAQRMRLSVIRTPLCMFGKIEDASVCAYSVRTGVGNYQMEIWLAFDEPLHLGLLVKPAGMTDQMRELFGQGDVHVGHDLFDELFVVRADDVDGACQLLDPELQRVLLVMHRALGPLTMTDEGVSTRVPFVPRIPMHVPKVVSQLIELASIVNDKRDRQRGPYR